MGSTHPPPRLLRLDVPAAFTGMRNFARRLLAPRPGSSFPDPDVSPASLRIDPQQCIISRPG